MDPTDPPTRTATALWILLSTLSLTRPASAGATLEFDELVLEDTLGQSSLVIADINGDGRDDLLASGGALYVLLQTEEGALSHPVESRLSSGTAAGTPVAVADIDLDGQLDAVAMNDAGWQTFLGDGSGSFDEGPSEGESWLPRSTGVALGDLDGDGLPDLATTGGERLVSLYRGDGHGGFAAPIEIDGVDPNDAKSVGMIDLDGDGDLDVVVRQAVVTQLVILWNDGAGNFGAEVSTWGDTGASLRGLGIADLDRDGRAEFLTVDDGS